MDALRRLLMVAAVLVAWPTEAAAFVRPDPAPFPAVAHGGPLLAAPSLAAPSPAVPQALVAALATGLFPAAEGNVGLSGRLAPSGRWTPASGRPADPICAAAATRTAGRLRARVRMRFAHHDARLRAGLEGRGALAPPYPTAH